MTLTATVLLHRLVARGKFRHLQVLLRLAELGSVQRAADAIGLTQSSVTQTLAYLEDLLGVRLFTRHSRGVLPTAACSELVPIARNLLAGLAEGAEVAAASQRPGGGVIRLVASASAANSLLRSLPRFNERHPEFRVHLREAEGEDQLLAVARGEVDLVACRRPAFMPEAWEFRPLLDDRFVVVCAARHPLLARRRIDMALLSRQTWLLPPTGSAARACFDQLVARFPQAPRTHPLVTRVLGPIVAALGEGKAIGLLPMSFVAQRVESVELAVLPVAGLSSLDPIGLLQPRAGMGDAAVALAAFLERHRS